MFMNFRDDMIKADEMESNLEITDVNNRLFLLKILGMQDASKKLTESLHEVYEPDWYGREDVKMVGEVRIYFIYLRNCRFRLNCT